jgi:RNA-binding protein
VALNSKQTQFLRALAHPLKPLVQVGNKGVSETLIQQVSEQLLAHELIKVRFNTESVEPAEVMEQLAERTESELVQKLGRTLVLYRRHDTKPKIELPARGKARRSADTKPKPELPRGKARRPAAAGRR